MKQRITREISHVLLILLVNNLNQKGQTNLAKADIAVLTCSPDGSTRREVGPAGAFGSGTPFGGEGKGQRLDIRKIWFGGKLI